MSERWAVYDRALTRPPLLSHRWPRGDRCLIRSTCNRNGSTLRAQVRAHTVSLAPDRETRKSVQPPGGGPDTIRGRWLTTCGAECPAWQAPAMPCCPAGARNESVHGRRNPGDGLLVSPVCLRRSIPDEQPLLQRQPQAGQVGVKDRLLLATLQRCGRPMSSAATSTPPPASGMRSCFSR
jgi:hypothetical protein